MNKQTILGVVAISLVFIGFAYLNGKEQKRYQEEMAIYTAYQDSVKQAEAAAMALADTTTLAVEGTAEEAAASLQEGTTTAEESAYQRKVELFGAELTAAQEGEEQLLTVENDLMTVQFSTLGGQIKGVELKEYTKYAPRGERTELVKMFDSEAERFNLSFFVRRGLHDLKIQTADYYFRPEAVTTTAEGAQRVAMRLEVAPGAALIYEYLIYNTQAPERDYLIDFDVRLEGLSPFLSNQTSLALEWTSKSYQNERGFTNENMYTTIAYHHVGEDSIEEMRMGEGAKSDDTSTTVDWVDFKQQFFSSVLIVPAGMNGADVTFDTAAEGSGYIKTFSLLSSLPYSSQTENYDMAFYFGPNRYSVLRKVAVAEDEDLYIERVIPLGWGIFGWINRWFVIPVFNLLRDHIASFGIIILILAVLIRLIISPLTYKSYVSMAKMRLVKPEMDALAAKYPKQEDAMKRQQATMELYKKAGINPMGGCIPMLIQMPILIAMFRFFPASIELRGESFLWAHDLSSYDSILNLPFSIPFYGDHVSLFALLMAASTFIFSYINYQQTASSQPQMPGMKFMMLYMMPLMLLMWFNSYASGLCYYYLLSNILTIAQTYIVRRMVDDDKIRLAMEANAAKKSKGKKSKFQQRYEELMRMQEMQQKQRK
ncbi:MAG: membrane protein insertase YidC [Rikenellaceae bacterium]|nr:membrane protein insertase YidC [Rikenellaceae bacterium]